MGKYHVTVHYSALQCKHYSAVCTMFWLKRKITKETLTAESAHAHSVWKHQLKNSLTQIRAMRKGSVTWAILAALSYFYMVSAWGGYVFITNLVPLHVLIVLLMGRFSAKIYICEYICYLYPFLKSADYSISLLDKLYLISTKHLLYTIQIRHTPAWIFCLGLKKQDIEIDL